MQKNNLDQFIFHNKDYKSLIIRISELADFVNETNSFKTLFFIDKNQKRILNDLLNHYEFVKIAYQSKIENSEYEFAYLYNNKYHKKTASFISLVKVEYKNKFITLSHKDILGAIMSLRIERQYLGDIIFYQENYYFEIANHLLDYLCTNIESINKTKVNFKIVDELICRKQEYQTFKTTISSLRLDNIVSAITKLSREKTKNYILMNNVKINQVIEDNISYQCQNKDILSLKGYGRFLLECNSTSVNKKNKFLLHYHKYI